MICDTQIGNHKCAQAQIIDLDSKVRQNIDFPPHNPELRLVKTHSCYRQSCMFQHVRAYMRYNCVRMISLINV
jgi:hypothetical protein